MATIPQLPVIKGAVIPTVPFIQYGARPYRPAGMPYRYVSYRDKANELLADYNDPMEINSLADVILNSAGKKAAGMNTLEAALNLPWERTIKPILAGRWDIAGLNALVNFGETLDVVANPVKALVKEGWAAVPEAIGFGPKGRRNFDMDTGSLLTDIGAEVLLDPLNWISLGGKAAASAAVKSAMRPVIKEVMAEAGEGTVKRIMKSATSEFMEKGNWADAIRRAATGIASDVRHPGLRIQDDVLETLVSRTSEVVARTVLPSIQSMVKTSDSFEKVLMGGFWTSSGFGLGWWPLKHGGSWVGQQLNNRFIKAMSPFKAPDGGFLLSKIEEAQKAFNELGVLTRDVASAENLEPSLFHAAVVNTATNLSTLLDRITMNHLGNVTKLAEQLDTLAVHQGFSDIKMFRAVVEELETKHPGVFRDLLYQLDTAAKAMDEGALREAEKAVRKTVDQTRQVMGDLVSVIQPSTTQLQVVRDGMDRLSRLENYDIALIEQMDDTSLIEYMRGMYTEVTKDSVERLFAEARTATPYLKEYVAEVEEAYVEYVGLYLSRVKDWIRKLVSMQDDPRFANAWAQFYATGAGEGFVFPASMREDIYTALSDKLNAIWLRLEEDAVKLYPERLRVQHAGNNSKAAIRRQLNEGMRKQLDLRDKPFMDLRAEEKFDARGIRDVRSAVAEVFAENPYYQPKVLQDLINNAIPSNSTETTYLSDYFRERIEELFDPALYADTQNMSTSRDALADLVGLVQQLERLPSYETDTQVQSIKELLAPLVEALSQYNPETMAPRMLSAKDYTNEVFYKLKYSQLYAMLMLMGDDAITDKMLALSTPVTGLGEVLNNLANMQGLGKIPSMAIEAQWRVQGYMTFRRLLDELNTIPLADPRMRSFALDTLMTYQRDSAQDIAYNFEGFFKKYIAKVEEQAYSAYQSKKLGLDDLRKTEAFLARFKDTGKAHTAEEDVEVLQTIITEWLDDVIVDTDDVVNIIFDTETEGFNAATDKIYDVTYAIGKKGERVSLLAKTDRVPSLQFLQKSGTTLAEFRARVAAHPLEELGALTELLVMLQEQVATGKTVRMIGHNAKDFDLKFVKERVRILCASPENAVLKELAYPEGMPALLDRIELVDTLELLRVKHGWQDMNPGDARALHTTLQRYTNTIIQMPDPDGMVRLFIQPVTSDLARGFIDLAREIDLSGIPNAHGVARAFREVGSTVYAGLESIMTQNRKFGTEHLRKTVLEEMGTNITQYLSFGAPSDIRAYGAYKSIDFPLIQEWFELPLNPEGLIAVDRVKRMTAVARRILETSRKNVKRLFLLEPVAKDIRALLEIYKRTAPPWDISAWMRIPENLPEQWAWLQFLYRSQGLPEGVNIASIPLLKVRLEDPSPLYDRMVYEGTLSFTEHADLGDYGVATLAEQIEFLATDIEGQIIKLEDLSRMLASTDMHRSSAQAHTMQYASARQHFLDMLQFFRDFPLHERYTARKNLVDQMSGMLHNMRDAQTAATFALRGEEFLRHLYHNARGIIYVDMADLEGMPDVLHHISALKTSQAQLKELGVEILEKDTTIVFHLNKTGWEKGPTLADIRMPELDLIEMPAYKGTKVLYEKFWDSYFASRRAVAGELSPKVLGSSGELASADTFQTLLSSIDGLAQALPEEMVWAIQERIGIYSSFSFNHSVLGNRGRRILPNLADNFISIWSNAVQFSAMHKETRDLYLEMVLHPSLGINTSPLYAMLSDKQMLEVLRANPAYRLVAAVEDNMIKLPGTDIPQGYRIINIRPDSVKSIQLARAKNAAIVPVQTYSKMVETINRFEFGTVAKWWHKLIYTYKVGYLGSIGTLARNVMDTMFKNALEGVNLNTQFEAIRLYTKYQDTLHDILNFTDHMAFNPKKVAEFYAANPTKMTMAEFYLVHDFLTDGPASMVDELKEYFINQSVRRKLDDAMAAEKKANLWTVFVQMSQFIMKPNGYVEQVARLAKYLHDIDTGLAPTEAFANISRTHFDYNLKSLPERYAELVIPFYTFTMRNLEYWVETMEKKPWVAGLLRDIMTPVWNMDGEDPEEYRYNRSVQYRILAGNAEIKDNALVLKLGPSFMDAFNLLTNPFPTANDTGALLGRAAAPLQAGVEMAQGGGLQVTDLPLVGTWYQRMLSSQRDYERTGGDWLTRMPSLFGAVKHWEDRPKKIRGKRTYVRRPYVKRFYPRSRRYFAKRIYPKTFRKTFWKKQWPKLMYPPRWQRPRNIYRDLYTSTGKSRIAQAMIPTTAATLKYKIRFTNPQFFLR
jgi:soluble cytochrome b562